MSVAAAYWLRNRIKFKGRRFVDRPVVTDAAQAAPTPRGRGLFESYALGRWLGRVSRPTFDETLGVLDLLDRLPGRIFEKADVPDFKVLDVGAKNWRYAPALAAWTGKSFPDPECISVRGIELDAYGVYSNFTTNLSQGRVFAALSTGGRAVFEYLPCDARNVGALAAFDLVTWFFPFVFVDSHEAWGLPAGLFDPAAAFVAISRAVRPGGVLIMTNHGADECQAASRGLQLACPAARLLYADGVRGSLHASTEEVFLSAWGI
ncbi:MAG: hypothetical protein A2583_12210 [Bdellovibrionales bacterium RIFOXYD1_FULL_53_11]|nr:MAG: hypothetical protein A2583_12210 [Bdellovibrionales bacterium RIFOXYD1_FULL_53_11]